MNLVNGEVKNVGIGHNIGGKKINLPHQLKEDQKYHKN